MAFASFYPFFFPFFTKGKLFIFCFSILFLLYCLLFLLSQNLSCFPSTLTALSLSVQIWVLYIFCRLSYLMYLTHLSLCVSLSLSLSLPPLLPSLPVPFFSAFPTLSPPLIPFPPLSVWWVNKGVRSLRNTAVFHACHSLLIRILHGTECHFYHTCTKRGGLTISSRSFKWNGIGFDLKIFVF